MKQIGEICCRFCNQKLQNSSVKEQNLCCDIQNIINDNGMRVCQSCGAVHGYGIANESIDFYGSMFRIRRKSVYHRKYHI